VRTPTPFVTFLQRWTNLGWSLKDGNLRTVSQGPPVTGWVVSNGDPPIQTYDRRGTNHNATKYQTTPKYPNRASQEASVTHAASNRAAGARTNLVNIEGNWRARSSIMMLHHASSAAVSIGQEICGLLLQLQAVTGLRSTCPSDGSNEVRDGRAPIQLDKTQVWLGGHLRLDLVIVLSFSRCCPLYHPPTAVTCVLLLPRLSQVPPSGSIMHSISSGFLTKTILTCAS
jgi:hypothetical protein